MIWTYLKIDRDELDYAILLNNFGLDKSEADAYYANNGLDMTNGILEGSGFYNSDQINDFRKTEIDNNDKVKLQNYLNYNVVSEQWKASGMFPDISATTSEWSYLKIDRDELDYAILLNNFGLDKSEADAYYANNGLDMTNGILEGSGFYNSDQINDFRKTEIDNNDKVKLQNYLNYNVVSEQWKASGMFPDIGATVTPPMTSNPFNITRISMPGWEANKLSLDFTNTGLNSTHLLACEFNISGDLTNSLLNPYVADLKPSENAEVTSTSFNSTFDSYITFGAWSTDVTQGYIEPDNILPTNTFDSSVTNSVSHKGNLLTTNGVKHLLWAPPGGTLKPTNNNFPISQIIIADSVNDATFSFVYGKGVLGNNDSNGVPQGRIINGTISAGVMTVTNYE